VIDCSIIYQVIPEQAVRIHIEWQKRYEEDFVRAVSRGVVRSVTSNYRVEEINSEKRQDLETQINDQLRELFKDKGFALDRFVLRNIAFSPEFATSIEHKQIALEGVEQSQHEADQIRLRAKGDADAVLVRAKAEAEALNIIAAALQAKPELLSYRYIEKLAPNIRVMLLPNNAPFILPLNEATLEGSSSAPATPEPEGTVAPGPTPTATPIATPIATPTP
jgi:regulator of protease activity HflC (stomatin/prohibitin superfamily)